jgi:hypothetical protein
MPAQWAKCPLVAGNYVSSGFCLQVQVQVGSLPASAKWAGRGGLWLPGGCQCQCPLREPRPGLLRLRLRPGLGRPLRQGRWPGSRTVTGTAPAGWQRHRLRACHAGQCAGVLRTVPHGAMSRAHIMGHVCLYASGRRGPDWGKGPRSFTMLPLRPHGTCTCHGVCGMPTSLCAAQGGCPQAEL